MGHLCFGSYVRILLYKSVPSKLTNKFFCGTLLKVFDEKYDITGDDDTVSKLLNGNQNINADIVRRADTIDPNIVCKYFEKEIIHRINESKKKHIVLALKELIVSDNEIASDAQFGRISGLNKKMLVNKTNFPFAEFLVDVFLFAVTKANNTSNNKSLKQINRSYCDIYEDRVHEIQVYDLPQVKPVPAIPLTVKAKKFDEVFNLVAEDKLSNTRPSDIKLYRLGMDIDGFEYRNLHKLLLNTLGEYVYSRVQVEDIVKDDEYGTIAVKALSLMLENGAPDEKGTGNELGELLLYLFLECVLQAPKLMSKVELDVFSSTKTSHSDGIHLLVSSGGTPFNQLVFGASKIDNDLQQSVDAALAHVVDIKNNKSKEFDFVESGLFYHSFSQEVLDRIKGIIIPQKGSVDKPPMAFGVFLGYSLGMTGDIASCSSKMESDIKNCLTYMKEQILSLGLSQHSFYVYVIPFNNAISDKKTIMENLMTLGRCKI